MAITEESRHQMYLRLEEILGAPVASTVMEHLPPVGWADVATKTDLEVLEGRLRSDLELFEHRLRGGLDGALVLRSDLDSLELRLHSGLGGEIAGLRAAIDASFGDFKDSIHAELRSMQRQMIFALVAMLSALLVGAAAFG